LLAELGSTIKLYRLICEEILYFNPFLTAPCPVCCNQSNTQSTISPIHSPQPTWVKQY